MEEHHIHNEPFLEPLARVFRFKKGIAEISTDKSIILVDIGCGRELRFYFLVKKHNVKIKKYIGLDPLINDKHFNNTKGTNVLLLKSSFKNILPLSSNSVDVVVGFAYLEHVKNPKASISEAIRILKKGGKAIFTSPSPKAKRILEFLAFKLGLISKREIMEHKSYFTKNDLVNLVGDRNDIEIKHEYFELGLNNLLVIKKLS